MSLIVRTIRQNSLQISVFILLSTLVGQCGLISNRKLLYILWIFMAFLLGILYTSSIESLLVCPTKEATLKTYRELSIGKYSLVIPTKRNILFRLMHNNFGPGPFDILSHMRDLKDRAEVIGTGDSLALAEQLVRKNGHAYMGLDTKVNAYVKYLPLNYPQIRCYKGEEKFVIFGMYWLIFSPKHTLLAKCFCKVFESGIYGLFDQIGEWYKQYMEEIRLSSLSDKVKKEPQLNASEPQILFSMENPQGQAMFRVYILGVVIGIIIFTIEIGLHFWGLKQLEIIIAAVNTMKSYLFKFLTRPWDCPGLKKLISHQRHR
ncbi:unnamed protein product [Allacma fusca]|uniref:Uncharacterized protein n=1 Tax=Allacma fusca TaxID=39272 RepID=A0A8J2KXY5_9HEXA|nr:unnamed protein product [Allacma fusca]